MPQINRPAKPGPVRVECRICQMPTEIAFGVPTYNGDLVSDHFPDFLWEDNGGHWVVCETCYWKHARGELKTHDQRYLRLGDCIHGAGI